MGESEQERFRAAAQDALLLSTGYDVEKPAEGAQQLRSYTMLEMAREIMAREGVSISRIADKDELVRAAVNSTSTFPLILSNLANKTLMRGYELAPTTFQLWAGKGSNRDFKEATRVMLSEMDDLLLVPEGGQFKDSKMEETSTAVKVLTFGRIFSLTRQAIINDDLGAFNDIAFKFGNSAKVKINQMVYGHLKDNTRLSDGKALFSEEHKNLQSAGAKLSVESLGAAVAQMRRQKHIKENRNLNVTPKYLIVPPELEVEAYQLTKSLVDPALNNATINPFNGRFQTIVDAELTDSNAWYLAADPMQVQTVEVTYLNGVETPRLETQTGFEVDGIKYKVGMDCNASVLDYRGLYKNIGA